MHAEPIAWKDTYQKMNVDFESAAHGYTRAELRKRGISKRNANAPDSDPVPSATLSFPLAPTSASAKGTVTQNFELKRINEKLIPPEVPLADQLV